MMKKMIKIYRIIEFTGFYLLNLIQANIQLAWQIMQPRLHVQPGIITIPLSIVDNRGILLLINLISMTPGTISLDLTDDKQSLYVHFLFYTNEKKMIKDIMQLEQRVIKLFK